MIDRSTDPGYLAFQYGNSEKQRIRLEAHRLYSERPTNWYPLFAERLRAGPGTLLLDVGCGPGAIQPALCEAGARVVGVDRSLGMVREAQQQAVRERLPVQAVHGDAQQMPFVDAQFDGALASHMLYHVPNIRRALEEMRRLVKPGGQVLITTNAADHSARLDSLHARAARELGLTPTVASPTRRFNLDHLALVRAVFPTAEIHYLPDAFVFPNVDAALRYYASGRIDSIERRLDDVGHREPLLGRMHELVGEFIAREGGFRVPKNSGYFLATVEASQPTAAARPATGTDHG